MRVSARVSMPHPPVDLSDADTCSLLKSPAFEILMGKPSTRPLPQLRGHLAYQRVGPFAFKEGPARYDVHGTLAPSEHDVRAAQA